MSLPSFCTEFPQVARVSFIDEHFLDNILFITLSPPPRENMHSRFDTVFDMHLLPMVLLLFCCCFIAFCLFFLYCHVTCFEARRCV